MSLTENCNFERFFYNTSGRWIKDNDARSNHDFARGLKDVAEKAPHTTKAGGLPLFIIATNCNNPSAAEALCGWGIDPNESFNLCNLDYDEVDASLRDKMVRDPLYTVIEYVSRYCPDSLYEKLLNQRISEMKKRQHPLTDSSSPESTEIRPASLPSPSKRMRVASSESSNGPDIFDVLDILATAPDTHDWTNVTSILQNADRGQIHVLGSELEENFDKTQVLACSRGREYFRRMLIIDTYHRAYLKSITTLTRASAAMKKMYNDTDVRVYESIRYLHPHAFVYNLLSLLYANRGLGKVGLDEVLFNRRDAELFPIVRVRDLLYEVLDRQTPTQEWSIPEALVQDFKCAQGDTRLLLDGCNIKLEMIFNDITLDYLRKPIRGFLCQL